MTTLIIFQKSIPDIADIILTIIGILLLLMVLNGFYEWLKTKPWKKNGMQDKTTADDNIVDNTVESHTDNLDQQQLQINICG